MRGVIYIMYNECMPGLMKIGLTTRSPEERARELSSDTSTPIAFQVLYALGTRDAYEVEQDIHHKLAAYRINEQREFFKVDFAEAKRVIDDCIRPLEVMGTVGLAPKTECIVDSTFIWDEEGTCRRI